MLDVRPQHIVDHEGRVTAVVLDVADWERLVAAFERLEDLDDVRAYDAAKAALADDELIPWEQAKAELEAEWVATEPEAR